MRLEKWGVDVEILKEPAIMRQFIGWTEDWEKEKYKDSGTVAREMLINKYKDTIFIYQTLKRLTMLMIMKFNFLGAIVVGGPSMEVLTSHV